jgi:tetratricopeptide (TPR) repeat protein
VVALNPRDEQAFEMMETAIHAVREQHRGRKDKPPVSQPKSSFRDEVNWFYCNYNTWSAYPLDSRPKRITTKGQLHLTKGESDMPRILPLASILESDDTPAPHMDEESDPRAWNEKGNLHFDNKNYEDAACAYNQAIELDPEFGQPYNNLALIYSLQGKYTAAILHYQKSIELLTSDQEKSVAWNGLGNAYRSVKDYGNASIAYQKASQLDKTNGGFYDNNSPFEVNVRQKTPDFWNALGELFFKTGVYDKAISAFQEAIRLEPSSGRSYGHLARALTAQGQYQEAVSSYHKSIDLTPGKIEKANVWNRLGDVHRKLNDYDNARKAYQTATALSGDKSSLLNRTRFSLLSNRGVK